MSDVGPSGEEVDFRAIAGLQSDLVFRLDPEGRMCYVSEDVERFLGRSREATLGTHFSELLRETAVEEAVQAFGRLLAGDPIDGLELELATGDSEVRVVRVVAEPIMEGGSVAGARGIAVDITDRRRREQRLERQRDELERFNRISATLREVQAAIVDAETERDIVERVCDRLADSWFYAVAWYGEPTDGHVTPLVGAGDEAHLDRTPDVDLTASIHGEALAERLRNGEVAALRDDGPGPDIETVLSEPVGGATASALVPVTVEGRLRGVVGLLAFRPEAFDERECEVLAELGAAIGDALAAAEARHEARLFRRVIDRSEDAIFVIDPADGAFVDVNGGACRQLGYRRGELLDLHVWDVSPNLEPGEWADWADRMAGDQRVFDGEHRTAAGDIVPVEVRAETVTLDDEQYIVALARDVSTQRELESEVTERTRELRAILDNAPVLAFRLEPDGSFSNWEGRGLDRLPLSPAEREALTLDRLENENAVENCRRALDGETFQDTVEFGGHYWETWYQPIHEGGEVTGAICFALDVTDDRRRAQVVEVLGRVLRHNLRNTMNIVVGEAARMQVEADDATVVEAAERITRGGQDLLDVADSARDIQRVVVDDRRFDPVDAAAVVESTCEKLGVRYPSADLSVDLDGASDARVPDTGFEVAVHELVENALEHAGRSDPAVQVALTTPAQGTVRVRVADDGPGLPEMEQGVLEAGGEEPLRHGQGLGLWLINWVVDETGGEMTIDVEPGEGTTVTVDLPRVEDRPVSDADRVAADADD